MSEYQDGWGYLTDSQSSRGTTNDGSRLCSRRPIPSPGGEPIRILVCKSPPYSLLGATSPAPTLRTGEFCLRVQIPNKALYCLILWLIGISSSAEPKKDFHLVPKPRRSCLLMTTPCPTPRGGFAATPPVQTKNQGKCCCPYVSGP